MADILKICPYCGSEYGAALQCCGEHIGHATYVIDDDEEQTQYDTYKEALAALNSRPI